MIQLEFCWWLVYGAQLSRQQFEGSHLLSIRNTTEAERRANKNRQIFRTLNLCLDIFLNVHVQQMSLSAVKHEALCSSSSIPFSNSLRVTTKKPRQNILYHSGYPECFTAIVKFLEISKKGKMTGFAPEASEYRYMTVITIVGVVIDNFSSVWKTFSEEVHEESVVVADVHFINDFTGD